MSDKLSPMAIVSGCCPSNICSMMNRTALSLRVGGGSSARFRPFW